MTTMTTTTTTTTTARGRERGWLRAVTLAAAAALIALLPAGCKDEEAERVEQTIVVLSAANAAHDADKIVSLLTQRTIDMYSEYVRLARVGTKDQLLRSGPASAALVLGLRLRYSEPQLRKMTGEGLIRQFVKDGEWTFLFEDDESFELGPAVVTGDSARLALSERVQQPGFRGRRAGMASLLLGKRKGLTFQVYMVKDDDNIWRLDETTMIEMQDRMVEEYLADVRMGLEPFLAESLEGDEGTPVPVSMWTPPKAGAAALRPDR